MQLRSTFFCVQILLAAAVVMPGGRECAAQQEENPVYVDDSPRAWEQFQLARDQSEDNPGEAVRLYQELLDTAGRRLVPRSTATPDDMVTVRRRVLDALRAQDELLKRYRLLETAEAERQLASGRLDELIRTRFLTEPALDAILQSAQMEVESARFRVAMSRLTAARTHPDLTGRRLAYFWMYYGAAAHHLGESARFDEALAALELLDEPASLPCAALLRRLLEDNDVPRTTRGVSPMDTGPDMDIARVLSRAIWSIDLNESLLARRMGRIGGEPSGASSGEQAAVRSGALLTTVPVAAGSLIYVNEGHRIRAIDRFSEQIMWERSFGGSPRQLQSRTLTSPGDLNVVVVEGDALVTMTGHAHQSVRSGSGGIVCLDAITGETRWSTRIDRLAGRDEFDGAFPHGTPIVADGLVFALVRKPTQELLSGCYLVALDLRDGRLRWSQYLASSGGLQREDPRPLTTPTYDRGDLFISTPIGAMACVEGATGEVKWFRRMSVPISTASRGRQPWEIGAPVVTEQSVIVVSPDQRSVLVLDRETGDQIAERRPVNEMGRPRYLLATDRTLYSIGTSITAFLIDDLTIPLWNLDHLQGSSGRVEIRGRVQLTGNALVVPLVDQILLLDTETGRELRRLAIDEPGNPLAIGPQLLVAGGHRLDSYMSLEVAESILRERVASSPIDPRPSLSLLRLAMRGNDFKLAIEAADMVARALEQAPQDEARLAAQMELFDRLLEIDVDAIAAAVDDGDLLHERIGAVAENHHQRAVHLLARGDWYARSAGDGDDDRIMAAVDSYQRLLADSRLAPVEHEDEEIVREAGAAARDRLAELIRARGGHLYDRYNVAAGRALAAAEREPGADALLAALHVHPFAPISVEMTIEASERLVQAGRSREALDLLAGMYPVAMTAVDAAVMTGEIVGICEANGWYGLAVHWLDRAADDHALTELVTGVGSRSIGEWSRVLSGRASNGATRHAAIGAAPEQVEFRVLPGRMVMSIDGREGAGLDRVLTHDTRRLHEFVGAGLDGAWQTELKAQSVTLIRRTDRELTLWVTQDADAGNDHGPSLVTLDARSGTGKRRVDELRSMLALLRDDEDRRPASTQSMPDGTTFSAREVLAVSDRNRLFVVGRSAGMAAFDLNGGTEPIWSVDHGLSQVYHVVRHELALVVSGRAQQSAGGVGEPVVLLIEPGTGAVLRRITPLGGNVVRWLAITAGGQAVLGTSRAVEVIDLASGARRRANVSLEAAEAVAGWPMVKNVLVETAGNELMVFDPGTGTMWPTIGEPADWKQNRVIDVLARGADGALTLFEERLVFYDLRGRVFGADAIFPERNYTHVLPATDRLAVISSIRVGSRRRGNRGPTRRYFDTIYLLSLNGKHLEEYEVPAGRAPLDGAALIDGWILLSSDGETVAIPAPTGS